MSPRSTCDRLRDILEAVERANRFAAGKRSEQAEAAVLYELIVIGEAVSALPGDVLEGIEKVPKQAIVGMRNLATHAYHRVDPDFVWGTVEDDLPQLREAVTHEIKRLGCPPRNNPLIT